MSDIALSSQTKTHSIIPPWLRGSWGTAGLLMILYVICFIGWTQFHWGGEENVSLIGNLAILPPMLLAALAAWRVAVQRQFDPRLRRAWFLLGSSTFSFLLGEAIWMYLENVLQIEPFPSVADIFFLGAYPLMLWGFLTLPAAPLNRRERLIFWSNLLIMLTTSSMFIGYFLIIPTAAVNNGDLQTMILATAYPVCSLILLGGALALLLRLPETDTRSVLFMLLVGITFFLGSDLAFGYASLAGTYSAGNWIDIGWHVAQVFVVLAALRQMYREPVPSRSLKWIVLLNDFVQRLPFLTILLGYGMALYIAVIDFGETVDWLFIASMFLTMVVLARQVFIAGFSATSVRTKLILTFLLVCISSIELVSIFTYFTLRSHPGSFWQVFLVTTTVVLILTTGVAIFLAQRFVAPISRLTAVARQIAAGNLTAKAQIESGDEIGTLAGTFNSMLETILRIQQELQESETLYRSLVDYSPDMISVSSHGNLLFINPAGVKLLGAKSADELIGQSIVDIFPSNEREYLRKSIEQTQAGTEPTPLLHHKMYRIDGTSFEAEFRAIPISFRTEPAIQFVVRDITERKHLEEEWQKFKLGIEQSTDAVFMTDVDGMIRYINPAFEKLYGYGWADAVGKTPRILKSGTSTLERYQHFWKTLLAKGIVRGEIINRTKAGNLINVEGSNSPILDESGNLIGFLGVHRDVSDRKKAEEKIHQLLSQVAGQRGELEIRVEQRTAELNELNQRLRTELIERQQLVLSLRDSEERFRLLFDASPDAILLIDPNHPDGFWPIVDCNEVACSMNGYRRDELIGQSVDLLHANPADPAERKSYLEFLRHQGVLHRDGFHRHKDGHIFPIEVSSSLITFAGSELILGIDRDITERKQTELALQQAKDAAETSRRVAEEASRAKSEFLSRMSHELRTPMNAILGFAQLLEMSRKEPLTSSQKERIMQIVKGGQHLLDLINEILDISRIEANRLQISPEPVAIQESIQEVLDLTVPLAVKRHIQIVTKYGRTNDNPFVMADRQRLKQVLLNLLSNAVKYNCDGGSVIVTCQQAVGKKWRISIVDSGPGISQENQARLFVPFERLNMDQPNVEGTGLGLVLAKRLIELMHGQIGVDSIAGRGSTFWIELPSAENPVERLERGVGTGSLSMMSASSRRILYIEDNVANFELIRQVFADYSQFKLTWSTDAHGGMELARKDPPDLILLDLHLGNSDGAEVLQHLKEDAITAGIPVVVVSADATPGQAKRLTSLGAQAYLTKPLNVKHFVRLVEELLGDKVA